MITLVGLALAGVAVALGYRMIGRASESSEIRRALSVVIRRARVRLGVYELKTLALGMVEDIVAAGVISLTTTYVPGDVVIGLHATDYDRYESLLDVVASEVRAIVVSEVAADPTLTLVDDLSLTIVRDDSARPGVATIRPRMRGLKPRRLAPTAVQLPQSRVAPQRPGSTVTLHPPSERRQ